MAVLRDTVEAMTRRGGFQLIGLFVPWDAFLTP